MRTSKLNKSYVDTKNSILKSNAEKLKALENEIAEAEEIEIFKGKTEAEKANIFWKHALPILSKNL